jgi:hypothetical protein
VAGRLLGCQSRKSFNLGGHFAYGLFQAFDATAEFDQGTV